MRRRQEDTSFCGWSGEVGEVIDIVKKNGDQKAAEELKNAYTDKFERNLKRW